VHDTPAHPHLRPKLLSSRRPLYQPARRGTIVSSHFTFPFSTPTDIATASLRSYPVSQPFWPSRQQNIQRLASSLHCRNGHCTLSYQAGSDLRNHHLASDCDLRSHTNHSLSFLEEVKSSSACLGHPKTLEVPGLRLKAFA